MGQVIREEGPQGHRSKAGTPTMGGLLIVPVGTIIGSLVSVSGSAGQQLLAIATVTLAYMVIGGFDDWQSLTKQTNTGLTPRGKLLLQALAAVLFLAESHILVSTWPEHKSALIDVLLCNDTMDPEVVADVILAALGAW